MLYIFLTIYTLFIVIAYELGGAGGEEVAVVVGVHYLGVGAEGVLGAVEEEVAETGVGVVVVMAGREQQGCRDTAACGIGQS